MSTQLGAPIPRKGYVYEIQYHYLSEEGRTGERTHRRSAMPYSRRVFAPWPDPRPVIQALESVIVDESRKIADALIAEHGDQGGPHVHLIHAIEVVSVTRVTVVSEIFGFELPLSGVPIPPIVAGTVR